MMTATTGALTIPKADDVLDRPSEQAVLRSNAYALLTRNET
jgi:hypothetical protein